MEFLRGRGRGSGSEVPRHPAAKEWMQRAPVIMSAVLGIFPPVDLPPA